MRVISNISLAKRAAEILDRRRVMFTPRDPDDAFGLVFITHFTEPDGTTVAGFRPGYMVDSVSPVGLGPMWALAKPAGAPEFWFIPRFQWRVGERYIVDIASERFELFSIGPVEAGDAL